MTTQNTTDNEPGEALKPCELCGVRLTLQGDYNHEAGWNWWGHPDPEQSNCLLARHQIDTMPNMETPIPADALRWNTRSRAPLAAVEGDALRNLLNQFLLDKYGCTIEHYRMKVLKHFVEWAAPAAAASSLLAEPPWRDEGGHAWDVKRNVTCVECPHCCFTFAAIHTVDPKNYDCPNCEGCPDAAPAAPLQPEGEQDYQNIFSDTNVGED